MKISHEDKLFAAAEACLVIYETISKTMAEAVVAGTVSWFRGAAEAHGSVKHTAYSDWTNSFAHAEVNDIYKRMLKVLEHRGTAKGCIDE